MELLLHQLRQLLGHLRVPLGLLGVLRLKHMPVGLLDELRAQGSLHMGLPRGKLGPVSEEVAADGRGLGKQGSWGLGSARTQSTPGGKWAGEPHLHQLCECHQILQETCPEARKGLAARSS